MDNTFNSILSKGEEELKKMSPLLANEDQKDAAEIPQMMTDPADETVMPEPVDTPAEEAPPTVISEPASTENEEVLASQAEPVTPVSGQAVDPNTGEIKPIDEIDETPQIIDESPVQRRKQAEQDPAVMAPPVTEKAPMEMQTDVGMPTEPEAPKSRLSVAADNLKEAAEIPDDGEDDGGFWNSVGEVAQGLGLGVTDFAYDMVDVLEGAGNMLRSLGVPDYSLQILNEDGKFDPKFLDEKETQATRERDAQLRKEGKTIRGQLEQIELGTAGSAARAISEFMVGFIPMARAAKMAGLAGTLGKRFVAEALASGATTAIITKDDDVRLSQMLNEVPALGAIIPDYLGDPDPANESMWEKRLKSVMEDFALGTITFGAVEAFKPFMKGLRSIKAAKIAEATDTSVVKPMAEQVVADDKVTEVLIKQNQERMMAPITDESLTKAFDDAIPTTAKVEAPIEGKVVNEVTDIAPDGKMTTIDTGDVNAAKSAEMPEPEVAPKSLADTVKADNEAFKKELAAKGVDPVEIEMSGNMSDFAGIRTPDGAEATTAKKVYKRQVIDEVKPKAAPTAEEKLFTKDEFGNEYTDFNKFESSEELRKALADAGEQARQLDNAGKVTHVELREASQEYMDDLGKMLGRKIDTPLTAAQAVASKRILYSTHNTLLSLSRKYLAQPTKELEIQLSKARAGANDIVDFISRGRQANGQALNAWNVNVGRALEDVTPEQARLVFFDKAGNQIDGAYIVASKKHKKPIKSIIEALDNEGNLKEGFAVRDSKGNLIEDLGKIDADKKAISEARLQATKSYKQAVAKHSAFDDLLKAEGMDNKTFAMMMDDVARRNPEELGKVVSKGIVAKTNDELYSIWINGILSSPSTHLINIMGNTVTAMMGVSDKYMSEGWKMLRGVEGASLRSANAQMMGMFAGILDGIKVVRGKLKIDWLEEGTKIDALKNVKNYSAFEGSQSGFYKNFWGPFMKNVIGLPGWALEKSDLFFKTVNSRGQLYADAAELATRNGLTGSEYKEFVKNFVANPTEQYIGRAQKFAQTQTFTNALTGDIGKGLQKYSRVPGLNYIIPFVRTPINILKYAGKHMPGLNLLSSADRHALLSGTKEARAEVVGRMATGGMLMGIATYFAMGKVITGRGPYDKNERRALMATGWQPYSIKVGDSYYSYERLDPIATMLGAAADVVQAGYYLKDGEEMDKVCLGIVAGQIKQFTEKEYLSTIGRAFQAIGHIQDESDPKALKNFMRQFADSMFIPYSNLRRGIGNAVDPTLRDWNVDETRADRSSLPKWVPEVFRGELGNYYDRLCANNGLGKDQPPVRDAWGEERKTYETWGSYPSFIDPIRRSDVKHDKVNELLSKGGIAVPLVNRKFPNGVELSNEEYSRYSELVGKAVKKRMDALVASGKFDETDVGQGSFFKAAFDKIRRQEYKKAREQMVREFPDLAQRWFAAKQFDKLHKTEAGSKQIYQQNLLDRPGSSLFQQ